MDALYAFGLALIQALQTLSPALDIPMKIFTFMGTVEFYMLLIPLIYWTVDPLLGARVFFALLTTDLFSTYFKHLLHEPRPYWVGNVKALGMRARMGSPLLIPATRWRCGAPWRGRLRLRRCGRAACAAAGCGRWRCS